MERCDIDLGQVIGTFYPVSSQCDGVSIDTFRMPTGCMPGPNRSGARKLCMSSADVSNPVAKYGSGVLTKMSSTEDLCNGPISGSLSWTFQRINVCQIPIPIEGSSLPRMITACDSDAGTYDITTYEKDDVSCSGSPTSAETLSLSTCSQVGDDIMWSNQFCF